MIKRFFLAITTTFILINATRVEAQEYIDMRLFENIGQNVRKPAPATSSTITLSNNEYKKYVCNLYLEKAEELAVNQASKDEIYQQTDRNFWEAYGKLINRCESYKQNTVKTIENDYALVYDEYWD